MAKDSPFSRGEDPPDYEALFRAATKQGSDQGGLDIEFPEAGSFEEMTIGQHIMYQTWRRAGFTPKQAIYMLASSITGSPGPAPDDLDKEGE